MKRIKFIEQSAVVWRERYLRKLGTSKGEIKNYLIHCLSPASSFFLSMQLCTLQLQLTWCKLLARKTRLRRRVVDKIPRFFIAGKCDRGKLFSTVANGGLGVLSFKLYFITQLQAASYMKMRYYFLKDISLACIVLSSMKINFSPITWEERVPENLMRFSCIMFKKKKIPANTLQRGQQCYALNYLLEQLNALEPQAKSCHDYLHGHTWKVIPRSKTKSRISSAVYRSKPLEKKMICGNLIGNNLMLISAKEILKERKILTTFTSMWMNWF